MFGARIYRHLTALIWSGDAYGIKLPGRPEGDLTVPCFACPWPGMNLPEGWKDVDERLQYV